MSGLKSSLLRIGVIGLGNMGRHHVRHWSTIPTAQLVAVCDSQDSRAKDFADEYGCKSYSSLEAMLKNETLDAVSLTVPTFLHFDYALTCLERGLSVLIEKPIAETVEQAQILIDKAKEKGVCLMIGHIERFNPAVMALKNFIDEGKLGRIVSLISRRENTFPSQMKDANVAVDLAVHDIDIVNYLMDDYPVDLCSFSGHALIDSRKDHLELYLRYRQASAFSQVNWITPVPIRKLTVTGTKGYVELDYSEKTVLFYPCEHERFTDANGVDSIRILKTEPYFLSVQPHDALNAELTHFSDCVLNGYPPKVSGEAGLNALSLALNALKTTNIS